MSDIYEKHHLGDCGRSVWIQRTKIPGVRKPSWSGAGPLDAPTITDLRDYNHGLALLADILKADVLEETL